MPMHSTARRLVVATLAFACLSLAFTFPAWRANLAHATGYSYLGCAEDPASGEFSVVMSDGDVLATLGGACDDELSTLLATCSVVAEDQFVSQGRKAPSFSAFYRLFCIDP